MEEWKDIQGYEGLYQVSNLGNIRSLDRRVVNHKGGTKRIVHGALLNPWDNGNGYLVVCLNAERNRKNRYVHRLVAEAFLENPDDKRYINHKDYDKQNNRAENLEWCTQKENIAHSICHMKKPKTKSRPTNTGEKYISERKYHGNRISYRVLIKQKGIDKTFKQLSEAIQYKKEVMINWQNQ